MDKHEIRELAGELWDALQRACEEGGFECPDCDSEISLSIGDTALLRQTLAAWLLESGHPLAMALGRELAVLGGGYQPTSEEKRELRCLARAREENDYADAVVAFLDGCLEVHP